MALLCPSEPLGGRALPSCSLPQAPGLLPWFPQRRALEGRVTVGNSARSPEQDMHLGALIALVLLPELWLTGPRARTTEAGDVVTSWP